MFHYRQKFIALEIITLHPHTQTLTDIVTSHQQPTKHLPSLQTPDNQVEYLKSERT